MTFKDQLIKLKENWLIVAALALFGLFMLFSNSGSGYMMESAFNTKGIYAAVDSMSAPYMGRG